MQEEIIIDGVNVAGCNFRLEREGKQKCECCHATGFGVICDCENWHNCYYKQIKRLEQENKDLKKQIESDKGLITVGGKQQYDMTMAYDKCKTTLEEIMEIIRADCKGCTAECDCDEDCTRYKIKNKIRGIK